MIKFLRKQIPERSKLRLWYHKVSAIIAAICFGFPSGRLKIIGVTGTSGKSSTVELIWYMLQHSGHPSGALSSIHFRFGDKIEENKTLRTSLRPWQTQKYLRRMVKEGCEYAVLEVSSHAIDQKRFWGVNFDTAVLTNISGNEHLDYHGTVADYIRTKMQLFKDLNSSQRKPNISKIAILNRDDERFDLFNELHFDKKWTYSRKRNADILAQNVQFQRYGTEFLLRVPNNQLQFNVPLIGGHNLENTLGAITAVMAQGIDLQIILDSLKDFSGIPSRLEPISEGQGFSVLVDFSYKPSALRAVLNTLKDICPGKIRIVWGGAGGRDAENWRESGEIIGEMADEIILTTDDPYETDPKYIAKIVRDAIGRKEGDRFFEIEDRYEAIRHAIFTAEQGDIVLVAGRGHEKVQTIGKHKIPFDDREVCREILQFCTKSN